MTLPDPAGLVQSSRPAWIGPPQFIVQGPPVFVNPNVGFLSLGAPRAQIYRTTNEGETWRPIRMPPMGSGAGLEGFQWLTAEQGWVAVRQRQTVRLWQTRDGGAHWQALSTLSLEGSLQFSSTQDGWALIVPHPNAYGGPEELVRTTDGGQRWHIVSVR